MIKTSGVDTVKLKKAKRPGPNGLDTWADKKIGYDQSQVYTIIAKITP